MNKGKKTSVNQNLNHFRTKGKGIVDDTTEYGEFVSTFDGWLPIEEQKKNAEKMEHLGD